MAGNTKDRGENTGAGRKSGDVAGKAQDVASSAAQKAQDVAGTAGRRAQEMASDLSQKAQDFASNAADRAGEAVGAVGQRMSALAGTLRESAPREGALGTAAAAVADGLEAGGQYLGQHDLGEMADEVTALVRRYPLQSVAVGVGVGCLLGLAQTRR